MHILFIVYSRTKSPNIGRTFLDVYIHNTHIYAQSSLPCVYAAVGKLCWMLCILCCVLCMWVKRTRISLFWMCLWKWNETYKHLFNRQLYPYCCRGILVRVFEEVSVISHLVFHIIIHSTVSFFVSHRKHFRFLLFLFCFVCV